MDELKPPLYGRALVVDDVEINLDIVGNFLQAYEITVDTVKSGLAALEKIKSGEVYDVIFMDYMMPGMNGVEATKTIRSMGYDHPIVALTANALTGTEEMFSQIGFSGFVSKPINFDHMEQYLFKFIRDKKG